MIKAQADNYLFRRSHPLFRPFRRKISIIYIDVKKEFHWISKTSIIPITQGKPSNEGNKS